MFSNTQPELPDNQKWLLDRMAAIGYKPNPLGVCYGVANMAMQALLSGEFSQFYRRLQLINAIPVDEMQKRLDKIKEKRTKLIEDVKKENIEHFSQLSEIELKILNNDPVVKAQLTDIKKWIAESSLDEDEKAKEFVRRQQDNLKSKFLQNKIDEAMLLLPLDEQLMFDIPAFFESAELYQQPYKYVYPDILTDKQKILYQDFNISVLLCMSKKLEQTGGIVEAKTNITGVYDKYELEKYINILFHAIGNANPGLKNPLILGLTSSRHAITIGLDPGMKTWQIIDMNVIKSAPDLSSDYYIAAGKTLSSLSQNGRSIFSTKLYVAKSDEATLNDIILQLNSNKDWQELHAVTAEKSTLLDSNNSSWLMLATIKNDINLLRKLIAERADVNITIAPNAATPLHVAAEDGNTEIVKILLAAGADHNARLQTGDTSLCLAVNNGHDEIVKLLLLAHADPDQTFGEGITALHLAVCNNHAGIVKLLLSFYANPNIKTKQDATPLFYAVINNRPELAKILLEESDVNPNLTTNSTTPLFYAAQEGLHDIVAYLLAHEKTDITIPFISTIASLRNFAIKRNVVQAMELFLKEKNASDDAQQKISMTPADIAKIMGHHDIVNMMQNRDNYIKSDTDKLANKNFYKYRQYNQNPELFEVFLKYHIKEDIFNKCLELSKRCKSKDNLPEVFINGNDMGHENIYIIKLPVADPHTYILGDIITNSLHSIDSYRRSCVMDGLTQAYNGYYVMVKTNPDQLLVMGDKLNPDCDIVGYGYVWLNENKDIVVIDSWANKNEEYDEVFMTMLPDFGKQITDKSDTVSMLLGSRSESLVAVMPEKMAAGDQSNDSLSQCLLYQNPDKISKLKADMHEKWKILNAKPLNMNFDEFCQFIMIDKATSSREIQNIESLFFNEKAIVLDIIFNEENVAALHDTSNVFRKTLFHIMTTLVEYGLFNDIHAKSMSQYLSKALKFDIDKLQDNLKYLLWNENQIKELKENGLLTDEIMEDVIAMPEALPLIMDSLKELDQNHLLTKDNAKLLFSGSSYYSSIVEALKLLNQKGMLNDANRDALTSNLAYAYSIAKDAVAKAGKSYPLASSLRSSQ